MRENRGERRVWLVGCSSFNGEIPILGVTVMRCSLKGESCPRVNLPPLPPTLASPHSFFLDSFIPVVSEHDANAQ